MKYHPKFGKQVYNEVYNQSVINVWRKGCILPFPKKVDLSKVEHYRGITLTCIAAKIYNTILRNRIQPEIDKSQFKMDSARVYYIYRSSMGQVLTVRRIIERVKDTHLEACIIFVDFSKAFDSIDRGKMSKILRAYGIPIETIKAIMMLYNNTIAIVRSPDGDTDFFDIRSWVLQGDTLAPLLFIICLDYVLQTSIDLHS